MGYFKSWRRKLGVVTLVMALMLIGGWGVIQFVKWRHAVNYPYGWSHCCDQGLFLDLLMYSSNHDGAFPAGEKKPEASLSLLYRKGGSGADANLLRGKSVPEAVVREILEGGKLLGPDSCGWHYVPGLRNDSDSGLALFWDKAGLDHNGGLLWHGGHIVTFVSGERRHITSSVWTKFLDEQKELHDQQQTKSEEGTTNDQDEKR